MTTAEKLMDTSCSYDFSFFTNRIKIFEEFVEVLKMYSFFMYAGNYANSELFLLISISKIKQEHPELLPSINGMVNEINLLLERESCSLRFVHPYDEYDKKAFEDYVLDYLFDARVCLKITNALKNYILLTPDFFEKYN